MLHLGDYFYEYAPGEYGMGQSNVDVRPHDPPAEVVSLRDYRRRHAQYKTDRDLQALHARYAWIVTWDDHEVTNDQWRGGAENHDASEGDYPRAAPAPTARTTSGCRCAWTAPPRSATARGSTGGCASASWPRSACSTCAPTAPSRSPTPVADGVDDPARTITGRRQMEWLKDSLTRGRGTPQWKVVGNPVMIAPVTFADLPDDLVSPVNDVTGLLPQDGLPYNVDQWDGYTADRREVLGPSPTTRSPTCCS